MKSLTYTPWWVWWKVPITCIDTARVAYCRGRKARPPRPHLRALIWSEVTISFEALKERRTW